MAGVIKRWIWAAALSAAAAACALPAAAQGSPSKDRHAGYYYPAPTDREDYAAEATPIGGANRSRRLGFMTLLANKSLQASYPPPYVMFAKGAEAEKAIIIGMGEYITNIYQARALLALLTSQARSTPIFQEVIGGETLTFLDLLKMLGFEQLTVSDGANYTLQITIK
jgi:hypothetical protein